MKLHLPSALRRALLAITALLSPTVVTTTIATATLAAITAPAMAEDLTLNANSNAFATDLTVEELNLASGVTSATLEPDRSTITTLTVTADSISLTSDQKLILSNAKIIANKGIQTLLANVAGKDRISMDTSSIWGSGGSSAHDVLLSSFINDKLSPNSQAYVYITKGHIQFDVGIDNYLSCNLGDGKSEDSGIVSATISSELDSLKIVNVASDATLDLGGGSESFILNIRSLEGTVKTGRDLTLNGIIGWDENSASIYSSSSVCVEENSTASITLEHVRLMGGSVSAHNIILKDVTASAYYISTLAATNELHIQGDIELKNTIANAGSTIIDAGKSLTLGTGKFTTGAVTIGAGATMTLGTTTNLKGIITNNGTLVLGGTITVDDTAFTAGTRERYSAGNNGYKITDTTYTVLTGGAATGTATWKVGTQSATYEDGMVIVDGIEDTAVYYVRNGDVAYTRALANDTTTFSLDGGHLVLNESLKDTQSIEWKSTVSWLNINNNAVELKSSQLSTVGAGNFTLIAPNGGTYIIDKKLGDIVELTLGTGVTLSDEYWWGWVKTVGDTTVSSDLDTTGWKNTELNGTTTVNSGVTLTLGGNTKLKGQIVNNGTLVLGGKIDVLGSMTHTSKATFATTGDASDLGTESGSGFASSLDVYSVVEGNSATGSATWTVDGQAAHYDSDKVSLLTGKDTTTWWMNAAAAYSTISGNFVTGSTTTLALNTEGGTLQLDTDPGVKLVSKKASTVEIGNGVTLNAAQLDASAADVTLSGSGSYTLEDGANALNTGVGLGSDWSGTVKLTGAADALELSSLGNALSSIDLGSFNHTLADGEHVINSALMGSGSLTLNKGSKLTLNGDCSNWRGDIIGQVELELTDGGTIGGNVQVDSLHIGESSTTFEGNLTTTGTITVSENATLSLNGNTTLGGTIESADSGTVELAGQITVDVENFKSSTAVKEVTGYFIGNSTTPNTTKSGFEAACWDITIAEGGTIDGTGATWKLKGDDDATFDFESDGTLHAYGSGVGSVFHVAAGDSIIYGSGNEADFTNSKGTEATGISLNGGTLVLNTGLRDNREDYVKSTAASTVEIGNGVELKAAQLDASAADVTLAGTGGYDLESGSALAGGVKLGSGWKGTVYTGVIAAGTESLDVNHLGNTDSTVQLGKNGDASMKSLTADAVGTVVTPGALSLMSQTSQVRHLTVKGGLTLGSADAAATLIATGALSTQGITLGNIGSTASAAMLLDDTLNLTVADSELLKLTGSTTVLTLGSAYAGTTTLNGEEKVLGSNGKMIYTLVWQTPRTRATAASSLVLQAVTNPVYVQNKVGEQVKHYSYNGRAGLRILNAAYAEHNPQQNAAGGALAGLIDTVDAGKMTDEYLAAVAGASTTVLGQALSGDVERQLRAIRNRSLAGNDAATITLVDEKSGLVSIETPARFFAWVNAEGNRAEQNDDSTAAGYTLTSWGGTLGAGMQVNDKLTLGLALTAMYGDLQSDGPDSLGGDMDTTYLSAFARYAAGKWSHALIGTVGTMEADYKRSAMSYSNDGDTDGTAFGLMYEVSREFELGNLSILSPVLNIAYRHTAVDSYSESGTDAALNVGKQSMDTVTLGAGARYAAVVGQQTLNRACGFEARALVKYDLGDTQTDTSVGFINHATRANIESAELGAFGVELGAGISVPVSSGSIFADGAVELRSDYTNFNATVGYRVQF